MPRRSKKDIIRIQEQAQVLADRLLARFKGFGYFYETYPIDGEVRVEVTWGDWKHDHAWIDRQAVVCGGEKVDEIIMEENGSDCYSSIHFFKPTF